MKYKKMDIVIWGIGELGKCTYKLLNRSNSHIIAFVDSNTTFVGKNIEGIPITSYEQLKEMSDTKKVTVLLTLKNSYSIITVLKMLENCNIEDIGIIKPRILLKNPTTVIDLKDEIIWSKKNGKKYNIIPRLEVNIVDGCNLNCRGCSHFSNLYSKDSMYSIIEYKKDLELIKGIGELVRLRLLGGEPFLAKNLVEYVSIARKIFPLADIELVTNGLLIPNINQEVLNEIKNNDISISISSYPPTLKVRKNIKGKLEKVGVWWRFDGNEIINFTKKLTLEKKNDAKISSKNCMENGCIFIRNGMLYKCPMEGLLYKFENRYGIKFATENRGVSLYDDSEKLYDRMLKLITEPAEMCQYCSEKLEFFNWEVKNNPDWKDWICEK